MMDSHTRSNMGSAKIAISIDRALLAKLDRLVAEQRFHNRSRALQEALSEKLERLDRNRLARECAKLDPAFEQALADDPVGIHNAELC